MDKRLDVYLVENGYARSRERAKSLIKSRGVLINSKPASKPSQTVGESDAVTLTAQDLEYVGRGALKLIKAFEAFEIDVSGMVCADIGASTGGFTEVLLEKGALKVYAVDVGHGQLDRGLAEDSRVVNCEGVNARELTRGFFKEQVRFISVDVSFISLKLVMKALSDCADNGGIFAVLIKPQFEAGRGALNKKGVVKDKKAHKSVLKDITSFFNECGLSVSGLTFSQIKGSDGNIEYLACLTKKDEIKNTDIDVDLIVDDAFNSL
ncbi:TlyA family RNA methyltransferase [Ruminococcus sp. Marseille-P6503]|uniref:TlyA family RNA methyltransferase n=1 Tax=Ruminococcus sp. Marseille-P6503 TaxID=2364796 RepID=UPI000F52D0E0|nr:TlyA family RNA methyltransferase [Ruminococcus sp. Marseille-P6503]